MTLLPMAMPPCNADTDFLTGPDPSLSTGYPRGGAHRDWMGSGTVTFFLTAPFKPSVHVVGDFNRWNPHATPMQHDGNGWFSATVPFRGRSRYQFVVAMDDGGDQVWVADPYAREITWDSWGPKSVLSDDPVFTWTDANWHRPALRDLIIYELCVRDFAGQKSLWGDRLGRFSGVQARLDHIHTLGANAIELMPVSEFPGDSSWGYNPVFYMAPKCIYGRPNDLKSLIDAAHSAGIAVVLDLVFNHAWADHPYYRMYPPLFSSDGQPLPDLNPFFHHHNNGHANSWGGLDWDHRSSHTRAYMQDVVRFWLQEYHVDGFRFDWVGGVEFDPWQPNLDRFDSDYGIAPIARAAREADPRCYLIGEYWPIAGTNGDKTAARLVTETDVQAAWNDSFHHTIERCLVQSWQWERQDITTAIGGYRSLGYTSADQVVNYTVCHDERRPEHEIQFWGEHIQLGEGCTDEVFPTRWDLAMHKARLGLAVLATAPGVPMLLAGQEFGEDSPRTIDFWPQDWAKLRLPQGSRQFAYFRRLLQLRHNHPALRSDQIEFYPDDFPRYKVVRYKRWDEHGDVVVVAANFDSVPQKVGLGFPQDGEWVDAVSEQRILVSGHWHDVLLPPWTPAIYCLAKPTSASGQGLVAPESADPESASQCVAVSTSVH